MERSTNSQCLCIYSGKFEVVVFSIFWSIMSGQSGVTAWMPAITAGINMIGNVVGSIWGAKPVPPPVAAPLPPPPPPQIEYRPVPGAPPETIYITQAPLPPPTAAPETLSYLGIIALVIMVLFVLACCASGIGFFFWQSQKAEKEKRDNESMSRIDDSYMESGRRRRGSRSGYSTSGTSRTGRTGRSTYGRSSSYGGKSSYGRSRGR
ncbi:hypothetical protein L3Y34_009545 [Caenorhabditis briggsae]|nr:hypothetical protein L3Y34_009545 [Caenorhabditis briggsae]